jgi:hypothetical protein
MPTTKIVQGLEYYNSKSCTEQPMLIDYLVDIVNEAYKVGEAGMWQNPEQQRTTFEEVR